jgi:hypothetical protein
VVGARAGAGVAVLAPIVMLGQSVSVENGRRPRVGLSRHGPAGFTASGSRALTAIEKWRPDKRDLIVVEVGRDVRAGPTTKWAGLAREGHMSAARF